MNAFLTARGARTVIETCAAVAPTERVLIVTDAETHAVADAVAAAALHRTPQVAVLVVVPPEVDGGEPPEIAGVAMAAVDVVVLATSRSISHSSAVKRALAADARVVSLAGFRLHDLVRGGIEADFAAQRDECMRIAARLEAANDAHLTSPAGTDLRLSLQGRRANAHPGIADRPGAFTGVPNIEANIAPLEHATSGTLVFDGSIPNLRTGAPLHDPVRLEVEAGRVVRIEGGAEADTLRRLWEEQEDATAYTIAQLAIGLNPKCRTFTGGFLNDHGVYGSVHIGIGTSALLGGTVKAPLHLDGMLRRPRLELDGTVIVDDWQVHPGAGPLGR